MKSLILMNLLRKIKIFKMANIFDSMRRSKIEAGESPLDIFFMDGLPNHGPGARHCKESIPGPAQEIL